jgi:uncharacterized membrane protein YeaQ/YmgE (transglycosylase-associated protein family)
MKSDISSELDQLSKEILDTEGELINKMDEIELFIHAIILGILGNIIASFLWTYFGELQITPLQCLLVILAIICITFIGKKFWTQYKKYKNYHEITMQARQGLPRLQLIEAQIELEENKIKK